MGIQVRRKLMMAYTAECADFVLRNWDVLQTMAIFLPEPLLDEPLFGVIARYIRDMGAHRYPVVIHVFGRPTEFSLLGSNLAHVERVTKDCWGLSAGEIAERMTCFPYYAALGNKSQVDGLRASVLSSGVRNNRLVADSNRGPLILKFCK